MIYMEVKVEVVKERPVSSNIQSGSVVVLEVIIHNIISGTYRTLTVLQVDSSGHCNFCLQNP